MIKTSVSSRKEAAEVLLKKKKGNGNMSKKRKMIIRLIVAVLVSILFCVLAGEHVFDYLDDLSRDSLFQHQKPTDGDVIVVGMDQKAVDEFGPMPWRGYLAQAIEYLNADPANRPAAICVDMLFDSPDDPEEDAALAKAIREGGNVVLASFATFGTEIVIDGDNFYPDEQYVKIYKEPFDDLKEGAHIGHINAMATEDGILRSAILGYDVPGKGYVYSMPRVAYEMYCEYHGIMPNPLPETVNKFYFVDFTALPDGYYEGISMADLVSQGEDDKNADHSNFRGKVVFIGPYTVGLQDLYFTAIDHAKPMYGVEWMANLVDQFREGFYPQYASDVWQIILLFIVSFGSLLFFYDRHTLKALIAAVASIALWIIICLVSYRCRVILHVLWIPLCITVMFIMSVALNFIRARREKRRVQNTFGHYVDPSIMKTLLDQGSSALELGGKLYDIAVLFVDVRGFTTMSENMDPPTVVEIVNRYLTLTTECIIKNHGVLDKFVGDCTMAFWNAPFAQEDPVYLACCAAMDMVEGSIALGEELQQRFGRSVSFGIGVNWGPAVVGNIGAPLRMDYTAIGDTVNTSARLEANAPGGQILISRAVADQLGDRAECTSLGATIKLKGKAEGFEILRLDSLKRDARRTGKDAIITAKPAESVKEAKEEEAKAAEEAKAQEAKAEAPKVEETKAVEAKAEEAKAEEAKAEAPKEEAKAAETNAEEVRAETI